MQFIHGIDLQNAHPCHNLGLSGYLFSPNALALVDAGIGQLHSPIESTGITELEQGRPQSGALSPRAVSEVVRAGILRQGQMIANGLGELELMSESTRQFAIQCSDAEIVFEKTRRQVAPNAASRLSCLYLAERTSHGQAMLRKMLGARCYILDVRIALQLSLVRVDSAWFDAYIDQPHEDYASGYWLGASRTVGDEHWEYLLDGALQAEDSSQLTYIRQHGARF